MKEREIAELRATPKERENSSNTQYREPEERK